MFVLQAMMARERIFEATPPYQNGSNRTTSA